MLPLNLLRILLAWSVLFRIEVTCVGTPIIRIITKPMVLVSYIPGNYISILQTKVGHREGHKARRIGLEAMPLDQHIEGGHGECQAGLQGLPATVHDVLEVAD